MKIGQFYANHNSWLMTPKIKPSLLYELHWNSWERRQEDSKLIAGNPSLQRIFFQRCNSRNIFESFFKRWQKFNWVDDDDTNTRVCRKRKVSIQIFPCQSTMYYYNVQNEALACLPRKRRKYFQAFPQFENELILLFYLRFPACSHSYIFSLAFLLLLSARSLFFFVTIFLMKLFSFTCTSLWIYNFISKPICRHIFQRSVSQLSANTPASYSQ